MKLHPDILLELESLSLALAALPRENVFSVPEGYFEHLPLEIDARVSAQAFATENDAQSFSVPEGYFEGLADSILNKIKGNEYRLESGIEQPFSVPEGYFEALPQRLLRLAQNDVFSETAAISSTVANIGNENVYQAPAGYFENFSVEPPVGKVVSLNRGLSKAMKYAAAAVVAGAIAFGAYFSMNKSSGGTTLAGNQPQTEAVSPALLAAADKIVQTKSFEQEFDQISADDIKHYLEEKGTDVETAVVASSVADAKELPAPAEYILDEQTLEDFLKANKL